jgi:hypothetical protein
MNQRDRDKIIALLKSVATPCEGDPDDHRWRTCRHCLAVEELENNSVRQQLGVFVSEIGR